MNIASAMNPAKSLSTLLFIMAIVYVLIIGQGILIPLILAVILWILVRGTRSLINRNAFIKRKFPSWLKSFFSTMILLGIAGGISQIIIVSTRSLVQSYSTYKGNISIMTLKINDILNIDINELLSVQIKGLDFTKIFSVVLNGLTDVLSSALLILIYTLFIFLEETNFNSKLKKIFRDGDKYNQILEMLEKIEVSVNQYLGLKILVSLLTGILSYFVLLIIGIDGPAFWAFLIFLMNFIPNIGSVIATFFPAVFSVLQFGEFLPFILILSIIGTIQIVVGNIIEPRIMGNSLNISSLVALISLVFWGAIWGVIGMLISIPLTVFLLIVLSQFKETRSLAILLSEKGHLNNKEVH